MNIVHLLEENRIKFGDYVKLIAGEDVWSLDRLLSSYHKVSQYLLDLKIKKGDRVAIILPVAPEYHVVLPAIWRIGAVAVPLHSTLSPIEIAEVLKLVEAKVIITTEAKKRDLASHVKDLSGLIFITKDKSSEGGVCLTDIIKGEEAKRLPPPVECTELDPAVIVFTSGSTGKPKGIIQSHANILGLIRIHKATPGLEESWRSHFHDNTVGINFASYGHTNGPYQLASGYAQKTKTVLLEAFDVRAILEAIQKHKVDMVHAVPGAYVAICSYSKLKDYDISSVKCWMTGAAPMPEDQIVQYEKILGRRIYKGYGLSESVNLIAIEKGNLPRRPQSVGIPLVETQLKFLDENGKETDPLIGGELCVLRVANAIGYLNAPKDNAEVFQNGWVHTGDLARLDKDGFLYIIGRKSQVINQGGFKIYPQEVEAALLKLEEIESCAVIGVPDAILGSVVGAFIKLKTGKKLTEDAVFKQCVTYLGEQKVPRRIVFLDTMPMSKTLKIDTKALLNMLNVEPSESQGEEASSGSDSFDRNLATEQIKDILTKLLKDKKSPDDIKQLSLDQPIMELGLTSLKAVEFTVQLGAVRGRHIPSTLIFNYPTLGDIIGYLGSLNSRKTSAKSSQRNMAGAGSGKIAIIGMSSRLPIGEESPAAFWEALTQQKSGVIDVPKERWDIDKYYDPTPLTYGKSISRQAAFLSAIDKFDANFFGLTDSNANGLDPHHRLFLELAWEGLENAGLAPLGLRGSATGVFVGFCSPFEYFTVKKNAADDSGGFLGHYPALIAGRLSYILGLMGPSFVVDTACSSSLVALHQACQSLRTGESDLAVTGGVSMIITPQPMLNMSSIGAMSPNGICRTFDAKANGTARGEGGGVLILKRLEDAMRDNDHIHAVISGSAVNQDGKSTSLTAPSGKAQEQVIRSALRMSGLSGGDVSYVEAHGTATPLGDPIELQAIAAAYGENRTKENPMVVGSVKTNIGHLEAAAGVASVIKVVKAIQNAKIPANLNFSELNPKAEIGDFPLQVPTTLLDWKPKSNRRIAGISSFGVSGTNAHAIVEESPADEEKALASEPSRAFDILFLSAKSDAALLALVDRYRVFLERHPDVNWTDLCYTANTGRSYFDKRIAIVAKSAKQAHSKLVEFQKGLPIHGVFSSKGTKISKRKTAFLFSGQGPQFAGMAKQLYDSEVVFHAAINDCAKIVANYFDVPLTTALFHPTESAVHMNDVRYVQVGLSAVEYAMAQLWISWGVKPDVVMGHSMGEFVAAAIAGVLSIEDSFKLIVSRAQLLSRLGTNGRTAAIGATLERVEKAVIPYNGRVSVSAINGPESTVVSGDLDAVEKLLAQFSKEGCRVKLLAFNWASHCSYVDPILDEFEKIANEIKHSPPRLALISNVTGKKFTLASERNGAYWRKHTREAVRFQEGMRAIVEEDCQFFLEMAPGTTLIGLGKSSFPADKPAFWLASLKKEREDFQVADSLAELFVHGYDLDWKLVDRDGAKRKRIELPTYPFQRKSHWVGPAKVQQEVSPEQTSVSAQSPLLERLSRAQISERHGLLSGYIKMEVCQMLALDDPSPNITSENLTTLGVDSLLVMDLRKVIQSALENKINIEPSAFFQHPTIDSLAEFILPRLFTEDGAKESSLKLVKSGTKSGPFQCLRPLQNPRSRLLCFHYAGGAARIFESWTKFLPADIELWAVQLPGRWDRISDPFYTSLKDAAQDLAAQWTLDNAPLVLFGHSLGALLAFEFARSRRSIGFSLPSKLIVSAFKAPQHFKSLGIDGQISDEQLIKKAKDSHMLEGVWDKPDLLKISLPILRADINLANSYRYAVDAPLPLPIQAIAGSLDTLHPPAEFKGWAEHTAVRYELEIIEGSHMFINSSRDAFSQVLSKVIGPTASGSMESRTAADKRTGK